MTKQIGVRFTFPLQGMTALRRLVLTKEAQLSGARGSWASLAPSTSLQGGTALAEGR